MGLIVEYVLLSAPDGPELSRMVNTRIEQGWRPFGSPFAFGEHVLQAVVHERGGAKRIRKTSED